MQLKINTIHVWKGLLAISEATASQQINILSSNEQEQAARFRFPQHRLRYIAAHYQLRLILSRYLEAPPDTIRYGYSEHQKPFLSHPTDKCVQFNISHSQDMAVYAIGLDHELGIDLEVVDKKCRMAIAERFFSETERQALQTLSGTSQHQAFYRIWSRKEALLKATGKGLTQSLDSFSVAATHANEVITIDNQPWQLIPLNIDPAYQAALACHPSIEHVEMKAIDDIMLK